MDPLTTLGALYGTDKVGGHAASEANAAAARAATAGKTGMKVAPTGEVYGDAPAVDMKITKPRAQTKEKVPIAGARGRDTTTGRFVKA